MSSSVQQLPREIEAEKSILAAALVDPSTVPSIADLLMPEDFYVTDHRYIMAAIFTLMVDGRPTDLSSIMEAMQAAGHMGNGQGAYLGKLMDFPAAVDLEAAAALIKRAASRRAIITRAHELMQACATDGDMQELRRRVDAAVADIGLALDATDASTKSPWDTPADLLPLVDCDPAPIEWFAENRIPSGRGIVLTGVGGSSKTTLLKQLGVGAVLRRVAWDWRICRKGRAVLILTEDTLADVHRSIAYICSGLELSCHERQQVFSNLVVFPLAGQECTLLQRDPTGGMCETGLLRSLERNIRDLADVVFVGIDPALSVTTGDELDQGHQRALGRMTDNLAVRTGATVCLVSHATKASLNRDELDSHNSRGGGAITDAVRAEFAMRTMTAAEARKAGIDDLEERKRHVQLTATKGNCLPPDAYAPVWLRRGDVGTLCQADLSFAATGSAPGRKDYDALASLEALVGTATSSPTLSEWRADCAERGILGGATPEAQKKGMQRIVKRLVDGGLIQPGHVKGVWLPGGNR